MKGMTVPALILLCALGPACVAVVDRDTSSGDVESERQAVMAADRAFDEETAARGVDGWVDWFAGDATMFPQQGKAVGHEAIREVMTPLFAKPGNRLAWRPTDAEVAASGDLAYTIGRWEMFVQDESGAEVSAGTGNYVTIWRKQDDGSWKVAVDIGNSDAREPAP